MQSHTGVHPVEVLRLSGAVLLIIGIPLVLHIHLRNPKCVPLHMPNLGPRALWGFPANKTVNCHETNIGHRWDTALVCTLAKENGGARGEAGRSVQTQEVGSGFSESQNNAL